MDPAANERLDRLETRVAALEQRLQVVAPAAPAAALPPAAAAPVAPPPPESVPAVEIEQPPAPVPPEPSAPEQPAPEPPAPEPVRPPPAVPEYVASSARTSAPPPRRSSFDLERFLGLAVLGRIGIAALVLAAAYFAQLGWGRLGPGMRVLGIYGGAAVLVAAGTLLRTRVAPKYIAMLWGGGTAIAYLAGVVARLRYDLVTPTPAMALLIGSAALGQFLARLLRLQPMATIALAGAYAAPLLVGATSASPTQFYVYLLALHAWAAWTEHRWQWHQARGLAVSATVGLALAWLATNPTPSPLSVVLHLEAVLLGLAAPELLRLYAGRAAAALRWTLLLCGSISLQAGLMGWTLGNATLPGLGLITGAVILAGAAALGCRGEQVRAQAADLSRLGGVLLAIGAFVAWNAYSLPDAHGLDQPWLRLGSLVAVAAALLALRRWTGAGDLAATVAGALGAAVVLLQAPTAATHAQAGLVLLMPAALLVFGRAPFAPATGLVLGSVLTFFGVRMQLTLDGPLAFWLPVAFAVTAAWAAIGALVATSRRDGRLLDTANTLLAAARWFLIVAGVWAVQFWGTAGRSVPAFGIVAGLLALGGAAAIVRWAKELHPRAVDLSRLGGVLLAIHAFAAWHADALLDTAGLDLPWLRLGSLVLVAAALLAARRWTGAGDLAATFAGAFGAAFVLQQMPGAETRAEAGLVLLVPAALVVFGRVPFAPVAGFALGCVLTFFGVRMRLTSDGPVAFWLPIAFAVTGAWAVFGALMAQRRRDPRLLDAADALLLASNAGLAIAGAWFVQFAVAGWTVVHDAAPGFGIVAGLLALGGAATLVRRAPELRVRAADLSRLGGVLLAIGAFVAWNAQSLPDAQGFDQPWLRLASLVAVAGTLLALRARTGADDLATTVAGALGTAVVLLQVPTAATRAEAGLVLLVPAALLACGRTPFAPAASLVLGSLLAFFGTCQHFTFAGPAAFWLPIAFGVAGGWAAGGALLASWRRDRTLLITASALLAVLGVAWTVIAFAPAGTDDGGGMPAFVNLRFLTALAVLAMLEFGRRRLPRRAQAVDTIVFATITLAFSYLAGLIETLALVRDWPQGWSAVTISLYTLLFAGALLVAGFVRKQPLLRWPGLCGFATVVLKVGVFDLRQVDTPLRVLVTGTLGLVLLLGAWAYARNRGVQPPTSR